MDNREGCQEQGARKDGRHARRASRICPILGIRVTYYLFAPQGSGEAESLTPLKRRTTSTRSAPRRRSQTHFCLTWGIHTGSAVSLTARPERIS